MTGGIEVRLGIIGLPDFSETAMTAITYENYS